MKTLPAGSLAVITVPLEPTIRTYQESNLKFRITFRGVETIYEPTTVVLPTETTEGYLVLNSFNLSDTGVYYIEAINYNFTTLVANSFELEPLYKNTIRVVSITDADFRGV